MRLGSRAGWGAAIPQHTLLWGGCGMGVELGPCGVMELREASKSREINDKSKD